MKRHQEQPLILNGVQLTNDKLFLIINRNDMLNVTANKILRERQRPKMNLFTHHITLSGPKDF